MSAITVNFTSESKCRCESCELLRTPVGNAMLEWGSGLIRAATEAVIDGADAKALISLSLQGPDAYALKTMQAGKGNTVYTTMEVALGDFGNDRYYEDTHRLLTPPPKWDVLKEEYADDPVIQELIGWMQRRTRVTP